MNSLIIPVYKNESTISALFKQIQIIHASIADLELVFVIDGSPDESGALIEIEIKKHGLRGKIVQLSRNFGSFAAIKAGLDQAMGPYFAVMAADCQEPPDLIVKFFDALQSDACDVVIGTRITRSDPLTSRWSSGIFWSLYRRLIQPEVPPGGVDVFGCNQQFRDHLLQLNESHSSLIGQLFWLGFRRLCIPYDRQVRSSGKSAWTLRKKIRYLSDSFFAFSDLPIKFLLFIGCLGFLIALFFALLVLVAKLSGQIQVPGYTTIIIVVSMFAGINSLGFGIVGHYVWRAFENTKARPHTVIQSIAQYPEDPETHD
ncbi:MAG: glycosyltransferase family 2 protein [Acidobacteria bacterium]|nr:glycosyltransferase family 2 protein [Acidobacteriota bacterium]